MCRKLLSGEPFNVGQGCGDNPTRNTDAGGNGASAYLLADWPVPRFQHIWLNTQVEELNRPRCEQCKERMVPTGRVFKPGEEIEYVDWMCKCCGRSVRLRLSSTSYAEPDT